MAQRKLQICWPTPDRVCLQGGCCHCQDSEHLVNLAEVEEYAEDHGMTKDLKYGLARNWAVRAGK